jgi:hypothetical protein
MKTIRRVGLVAVSAMASLAFLGVTSAAAFPPAGTAVSGVDDGRGIDFGTLTSCRASLSGHVTGHEMFGGGTISVDQISFTGCSSGATVTANDLPWTIGTDATLGAVLYPNDVSITTSRGTCRYSGDLLGYTNGSGTWFLNGPVFQRAAGCGGADQLATRIGARLSDAQGNPVGL